MNVIFPQINADFVEIQLDLSDEVIADSNLRRSDLNVLHIIFFPDPNSNKRRRLTGNNNVTVNYSKPPFRYYILFAHTTFSHRGLF